MEKNNSLNEGKSYEAYIEEEKQRKARKEYERHIKNKTLPRFGKVVDKRVLY